LAGWWEETRVATASPEAEGPLKRRRPGPHGDSLTGGCVPEQ